jgi:hypothetical protein
MAMRLAFLPTLLRWEHRLAARLLRLAPLSPHRLRLARLSHHQLQLARLSPHQLQLALPSQYRSVRLLRRLQLALPSQYRSAQASASNVLQAAPPQSPKVLLGSAEQPLLPHPSQRLSVVLLQLLLPWLSVVLLQPLLPWLLVVLLQRWAVPAQQWLALLEQVSALLVDVKLLVSPMDLSSDRPQYTTERQSKLS